MVRLATKYLYNLAHHERVAIGSNSCSSPTEKNFSDHHTKEQWRTKVVVDSGNDIW